MKYCLSFLLCVSLWINCFADCPCSKGKGKVRFSECPKTYVTPDQIDLHEDGIFVRINDRIVQTESLSTDTQGVYFQNVKDGCGPSQWRCFRVLSNGMVCETCNWDWNYSCSYCGKDKR